MWNALRLKYFEIFCFVVKILTYTVLYTGIRSGCPRMFHAFAPASAKQKRARKREEKKREKLKGPSAKEISAEFTLFLSLPHHPGNPFQSPNQSGRGKSNGLE
jgi:hypothetical protein